MFNVRKNGKYYYGGIFTDLRKLFTKRVNLLFGFGCLLPVVMFFASFIPGFYLGLFSWWSGSLYWLGFIAPQAIYPIVSALVFRFAYGIARFKVKETVKAEKSGVGSYLLYIPAVILVSMLLSSFVNTVFNIFSSLGIDLPTVSSSIPDPSNALESVALVVVMAILPAICEEFIFRFTFVGILSPLSRGGAIIISSLAFGLMHGTLEQIFATFCLGICLAFVYVYTGNYRLPIAIHFVNNFISCLFIILGVYLPEGIYTAVERAFVLVLMGAGIISLGILLFFKRPVLPKIPQQIKTGEALVLALKAPLFWVFTLVYIGITTVSTLLLS